MITTAGLRELTGYPMSVCSNFMAGRYPHVGQNRVMWLRKYRIMSHCQLIEAHLEKGGTLTMAQALNLYGIGALSQRVRELNIRYQRRGEKRRIVNLSGNGIGEYAIYKMEMI